MKFIQFIFSFLNNMRKALHFLLLLFIFGILLAVLTRKGIEIPESAALVLAPSGVLVEQLEGDPLDRALAEIEGSGVRQTLVKDVTDSLEAAAEDDRIRALVLDLSDLQGGGLSKLQAIAAAIRQVQASGKQVLAVGDGFTQAQYYLAAHADAVYLHELGAVFIDGYGYYRTFLKGAIDKLKIDLNAFRVGKYKSFVEPFIRDSMSDEDREASQRWLDALWASYQRDVVEARGLEPGSLDRYANEFTTRLAAAGGDTARVALDSGLVDYLAGREAIRKKLIELVGESDTEDGQYNRIGFADYLQAIRLEEGVNKKAANVGVLVASGEIVDGEAPRGTIGGDTLAALVNQAARDKSIKALVMLVDSPGGSMFASEVVFEELQNLKAMGKPLIVSMSTVAASGGYYIAMPADEIWASENTITGSIGVGALIPTFQRGLDSLGIHVDGIGTTRLSGQFRLDRALGEDVRQVVQMSIEDAYRVFVGKVADQRGMSVERAENLARGRVWIGSDAFELGLVDQLGDLDQAIEAAATRADLADGKYGITYIERKLSIKEQLALQLAVTVKRVVRSFGLEPARMRGAMLAKVIATVQRELEFLENLNDPRGLYYHCFCELP